MDFPHVVIARMFEHIGPIDRGERYEDPLHEVLEGTTIGRVTGGGSQLNELGGIEFADVEMELADLDDALRAGLVAVDAVPPDIVEVLGATHSRRINTLVSDVIAHSDASSAPGHIAISLHVQQAADSLREFLFRQVYTPLNEDANTQRAQHIVRALYAHFLEDPDRLPAEYRSRSVDESPRRVADFVASMTDRYAIELYEAIFVPHHWSV